MVATVAENAGAHGLEAPEMGPIKYKTIFRTCLSQTGAKSVSFYQGAVVRVRITFHGVGPVGWRGVGPVPSHLPLGRGKRGLIEVRLLTADGNPKGRCELTHLGDCSSLARFRRLMRRHGRGARAASLTGELEA